VDAARVVDSGDGVPNGLDEGVICDDPNFLCLLLNGVTLVGFI